MKEKYLPVFSKLILGLVFLFLTTALLFRVTSPSIAIENTYDIFRDDLSSNWVNWSWGGSVSFSDSIEFRSEPWSGLYLHTDKSFDSSLYSRISFVIKRSRTDQNYKIIVYGENNQQIGKNLDIAKYKQKDLEGGWEEYSIGFDELEITGKSITGVAWQEANGISGTTSRFDSLALKGESNSSLSFNEVFSGSEGVEWKNWSWGGNVQTSKDLVFTSQQPWAGLYLRRSSPIPSTVSDITWQMQSGDNNYQFSIYSETSQPIVQFEPVTKLSKKDLGNGWIEYSYHITSHASPILGLIIQDTSGQGGRSIKIDNIRFATQVISTPTPTPNPVTVSVPSTPSTTSKGYKAINNKIYRNDSLIKLTGISWFGAETETRSPHGLWSRNWLDMIRQMRSLGFNSIRIPICPQTLGGFPTEGIDFSKNPDLKDKNSLQVLDVIMNGLNDEGMHILLDHHRINCQTIPELWYEGGYTEAQWMSELTMLAERYKNLPFFMGIDIKNEPHGKATWGTGNSSTDWNIAAEKAGKAINSVNPNILIFVQGVQENPTCSSNIGHWMGGNLEPIKCSPISSDSIPQDKLVLSPHVYGPDVYPQGYFNDSTYPNNLRKIWETHFGELVDRGYTVVPGEWGGKYGQGDSRDKIWQDTIVSYFKEKGICNSYYWSWNPNSVDTGGILKDDWQSVNLDKLNLLKNYSSCN